MVGRGVLPEWYRAFITRYLVGDIWWLMPFVNQPFAFFQLQRYIIRGGSIFYYTGRFY